jgi:hypothetical protein
MIRTPHILKRDVAAEVQPKGTVRHLSAFITELHGVDHERTAQMTYQDPRNLLPDLGVGRNPPKYRKVINTVRFSTGAIAALVVASFLGVGGIYYYMSGAPLSSASNPPPVTTGQGGAPFNLNPQVAPSVNPSPTPPTIAPPIDNSVPAEKIAPPILTEPPRTDN